MMSSFERKPPAYYWVVAALLTLWEAIGCYFCYLQFRLGADWMPNATDYDRALQTSMPGWYNWCYALAVGSGTLGGLALLARRKVARPLFIVSLVALVIQFGYLFLTSDLIAHKGAAATLPFPVFIALVGAFAIWFAGRAQQRSWLI